MLDCRLSFLLKVEREAMSCVGLVTLILTGKSGRLDPVRGGGGIFELGLEGWVEF